ncbi:MAG: hypothetical protein R8K49_09395 [Mariprofundaceae bacterium]
MYKAIRIVLDLRSSDPSDRNDIINIAKLPAYINAWEQDNRVSFKIIDEGEAVYDDSRLTIDFTSVDDDVIKSFKSRFIEPTSLLLNKTDVEIFERHMVQRTGMPGDMKEPKWLQISLQT